MLHFKTYVWGWKFQIPTLYLLISCWLIFDWFNTLINRMILVFFSQISELESYLHLTESFACSKWASFYCIATSFLCNGYLWLLLSKMLVYISGYFPPFSFVFGLNELLILLFFLQLFFVLFKDFLLF